MEDPMASIDPNQTEAGTDNSVRKNVPMTPRKDEPGWGIPILFAAVALVAGILIFSAAGPDRTRTAEYNNPNSQPSQTAPSKDMRGPAAQQPNPDMPTAPKKP
jgi:hypothetical protein